MNNFREASDVELYPCNLKIDKFVKYDIQDFLRSLMLL